MRFPDVTRVLYENNPLVEVVCQLTFDPILKIQTEAPAAFQDRIRHAYPRYTETRSIGLDLPDEVPDQIRTIFDGLVGSKNETVGYEFHSKDETTRVVLARDFVALTTTQYERWESFRDQLKHVIEEVQQVYSPNGFRRIGLRYKNLIVRSSLGIPATPWSQLLCEEIAGELLSSDLEGQILGLTKQLRFANDDHGVGLNLMHGLVPAPEGAGAPGELSYLIDEDFFKEGDTDGSDAIAVLDHANKEAGRLFQWCASEALHELLRPVKA